MEKKIPWWQPQVGSEADRRYINQTLDTSFVNEGPLAAKFEEAIAAIVGSKYAIAVSNGTSAIFLALKALGINHGDEVIVPDMTFIATANAAEMTGATPILVDVDKETMNISVDAIKAAITPKTKAIVPVHVTGRGADMSGILTLAQKHQLAVVEDAAEALTSKQQGKCLGTFGNAGCFSFSPNKTITCGQGGMIVTDDVKLLVKLRMLKDQGRPSRGTGGDDKHDVIGYNFKLTDLQCALGLGQLEQIEKRANRMRRNYTLYLEHLTGVGDIQFFTSRMAEGELPQWTDIVTEKRDALAARLQTKNIDSRKYWFPLHRQLAYHQADDKFPNSCYLSPRSLWLPSAFTLTDEDIMTVCSEIKSFFRS